MSTDSPSFIAAVVLVAGCSKVIGADFDDARPRGDDASQGGSAGSGGMSGTASGGVVSGGGVAPNGGATGGTVTGGATTGGTASEGGSGGTRTLNCNGDFLHAQELPVSFFDVTSLSVTADETEFFVSTDGVASDSKVYRHDRLTSTSSEVEVVKSACPPERQTFTVDVSEDGQRLYFTCSRSLSALSVYEDQIYVAHRASRMDPFGGAEPVGAVPARFSLSADELSAFSSLAADATLPGRTMSWQREAGGNFSEPTELSGLTGSHDLLDPDPTSDGLALFGVRLPDYRLVVATRPNLDDPFGEPRTIPWTVGAEWEFFSPAISADCLTLYFVGRQTPPVQPERASIILAAYREKCKDFIDNDNDLDIDCDDADCETDAACP